MKKLLFSFTGLLVCITLLAQAPERFQYQTVVRDNAGQVLANRSVGFQISIHQGSALGAVVYSETHSGNTNDFGLVTLEIGGGTVVSGTMGTIDWGNDDYFIEIEIDPAGGSSYVSVSTTQLLSVPYALNSRQATDMALNDLTNVGGSPANGEVLKWDGSTWAPAMDEDTDNQTLSINNDELTISGGNTISIPAGDITGVTAGTGLGGGGTSGAVTLSAQNSTAMWNASQLQGRGISFNTPTAGQVLKWNGTNWVPAADSAGSDAVWSTNGLSAFYNTGNVGIGTAGPSANLQIDADSGQNPLRIRIDGQTKLMVHKNGGTGIGYSTWTPPENGLLVQGDIGIGTSSPSFAKMHFHTDGFQDAIRITSSYTGTTQSDGAYIDLQTVNFSIINRESGNFSLGTGFKNIIRMFPDGSTAFNDLFASATVHIKQLGNGEEALALENDGDTDTWSYEVGLNDLNIYFNGSQVGYWDDATGSYYATSDATLKKDIAYLDQPLLPAILQLRPASYRLLHAETESEKTIGFVAQEVQKWLPQAVHTREDGKLSINYNDFGVLAIKAIQEQQAEIELLKAQVKEIDALKAEVEALKRLMKSE